MLFRRYYNPYRKIRTLLMAKLISTRIFLLILTDYGDTSNAGSALDDVKQLCVSR